VGVVHLFSRSLLLILLLLAIPLCAFAYPSGAYLICYYNVIQQPDSPGWCSFASNRGWEWGQVVPGEYVRLDGDTNTNTFKFTSTIATQEDLTMACEWTLSEKQRREGSVLDFDHFEIGTSTFLPGAIPEFATPEILEGGLGSHKIFEILFSKENEQNLDLDDNQINESIARIISMIRSKLELNERSMNWLLEEYNSLDGSNDPNHLKRYLFRYRNASYSDLILNQTAGFINDVLKVQKGQQRGKILDRMASELSSVGIEDLLRKNHSLNQSDSIKRINDLELIQTTDNRVKKNILYFNYLRKMAYKTWHKERSFLLFKKRMKGLLIEPNFFRPNESYILINLEGNLYLHYAHIYEYLKLLNRNDEIRSLSYLNIFPKILKEKSRRFKTASVEAQEFSPRGAPIADGSSSSQGATKLQGEDQQTEGRDDSLLDEGLVKPGTVVTTDIEEQPPYQKRESSTAPLVQRPAQEQSLSRRQKQKTRGIAWPQPPLADVPVEDHYENEQGLLELNQNWIMHRKYIGTLQDLASTSTRVNIQDFLNLFMHLVMENPDRFERAAVSPRGEMTFTFKLYGSAAQSYSLHPPHGRDSKSLIPFGMRKEYYFLFETLLRVTPNTVSVKKAE